MKIVVTTPTGHVGSCLVPLLLKAGETPTLFCRSAERLPEAWRGACDIVEGDQGNSADVARAIDGADVVYWVSPPTDDADPIDGYTRMTASLVTALAATGTNRVVFQSSVGAEARHGFGDIDGLGATEHMLDDLGISVTHLRCGYLFSNLFMDLASIREGEIITTLPVHHAFPWVAAEDVAVVAALRLLGTSWRGRHVLAVHGPVDLSFAQVAEVLSRVLGERRGCRRAAHRRWAHAPADRRDSGHEPGDAQPGASAGEPSNRADHHAHPFGRVGGDRTGAAVA